MTREENTDPVTQPKPKDLTKPPDTALEATGATKAVKASNVTKTTMEKTTKNLEVARNTPARDATDKTNMNARRTWHCMVCNLSATLPEHLTTHMMDTHRDDNLTLSVENTPTELKISMEGTSNCGQRKDTYQAIGFKTDNPDNTKETPEQQEKAANRNDPDNKAEGAEAKTTDRDSPRQ